MKLVLDVENTVSKRDGVMYLDPFEKDNSLVMVGVLPDAMYKHEEGPMQDTKCQPMIFTFDHSDHPDNANTYHWDADAVTKSVTPHVYLQRLLDQTTVLIGHNISHDLIWLWESGFTYNGPVWDTMVAEYIMLRGQKAPLSLDACAKRHELATQKGDTLKNYLKQGWSVRDIPWDELTMYLEADLYATQQLMQVQRMRLYTTDMSSLESTLVLSNEMTLALTKMYQRGFKVDLDALNSVREQFVAERSGIVDYLEYALKDLMGDVPINLASPEQLSSVIYSRKPKDKKQWSDFGLTRMSEKEFRDIVNTHTEPVYKSYLRKCADCYGSGLIRKRKKNGEQYKKENKCSGCTGNGYTVVRGSDIAGLRISPPYSRFHASHGFTTNKSALEYLGRLALQYDKEKAADFLGKVQRLSALDTYINSFVDGIKKHVKDDGFLHVRLNQHMTSTGRLSGKEPNMQNMPRGGTFPVKKVFVSRWEGGKILEADFAQLEFRAAAFLSQDDIAMQEVRDGFDVHAYTASVITEAGQKTSRQDAKAHTFAPLYGATGYGRTKAEAEYYTHFVAKYKGIADWHQTLARDALTKGVVTTPSGRVFTFPNVQRKVNGTVTYFTQIKNYPVQSFATADIVPLAFLEIDRMLRQLKSCIVNTVHDSIVIDVHPNEEASVTQIIDVVNRTLKDVINLRWGIDFNVPLVLEPKIGFNWLELTEAA